MWKALCFPESMFIPSICVLSIQFLDLSKMMEVEFPHLYSNIIGKMKKNIII